MAKRAKKPPVSDTVRAYLSAIGKIGGNVGGKPAAKRRGHLGGTARAENLSATERQEAASAAATVRWSRKTREQRRRIARALAKARWAKKSSR